MINNHGYSDLVINDMLRMKGGSRKVSFRFDLINKDEVKIGELDCISARVRFDENRAIARSAVFVVPGYEARDVDFLSHMIKPWFILEVEEGKTVEWPLGLFILGSPRREFNDGASTVKIGAYDRTMILEEDRFTERFYISRGTAYAGAVERILNTSGIIESNIAQSDYALVDDIEYPAGMRKRQVINTLLRCMNYSPVFADENGVITAFSYIMPGDRGVNISYSSKRDSIIYPRLEESLEMAGTPNVYVCVASNVERAEIRSVYENNDQSSPFSIQRRGRRIVDYAEIDNITSQELLDLYAKRTAVERTAACDRLSFSTVLMPGHGFSTTLLLDIPEVLDEPARFSECAWDMDLRYDGEMRHEVRRVITL
ncbi:MAG: hypothetical protein LBS19_14370 [Clostridiales bacterium]|jgi:hypothetical protein|nr:hypothetical protein [Clostridiales bacterium]